MRIHAIPITQMTAAQAQAWSAIQRGNAALDSPLFRPEFAQIVASVRDDVEVAILERDGAPVGFLPFHRDSRDKGTPLAEVLSDVHGMVASSDLKWNALQLLRSCGLQAWSFDHLVIGQTPFQPYIYNLDDSPFIDLSDGYEAYLAARRAAGVSAVTQTARKARKIAREVGPLRLELRSTQPSVLKALIAWKQVQLADKNYANMFRLPWLLDLLNAIQAARHPDFEGWLSALYAGDRLIAIHLGMQSGQVLTSSIPTFDPEFSKYSPGLLLHLELAKQASAQGVTRIDLGRGRNRLKNSLMTGAFPVGLGCVDRRLMARQMQKNWFRLRTFVHATPLSGLPLQLYRRLRNSTSTS